MNLEMQVKKLVLVALALLVSGTGAADTNTWGTSGATGASGAMSATGVIYQQSYEDEAAGHYAEALAAMTALDRLPGARGATYVAELRRGWLLYKLARYGEAVQAYNRAASAAPSSVEARVGALLPLMAERRWATADKTARDALKHDPHNYLATLRLAFITYNQGQYTESAALYQKLAEAYPSDIEVRSGLGWALLKLGRTGEAAAQFQEILDVAPRHALAREGLGAAR